MLTHEPRNYWQIYKSMSASGGYDWRNRDNLREALVDLLFEKEDRHTWVLLIDLMLAKDEEIKESLERIRVKIQGYWACKIDEEAWNEAEKEEAKEQQEKEVKFYNTLNIGGYDVR